MTTKARDIIWIVLDGMRSEPSPHPYRALDLIREPAENAAVFSRTYTSAVSTGMSWLATLTSAPVHYYARDHASSELLKSATPIFPSILQEAGYESTFFIGHHETRRKFVNYFDTRFFDRILGQSPDEGIRCNTNDGDVLEAFFEYLRQREPGQPIFSIIHLIQPAHYEEHYQELRAFLTERGYLADSNAIVVTTGDHGMDELVADGSILRHDSVMTQPNMITMARIEGRGLPARSIDTPILLMDIPPTLLELAGIEKRIETRHAVSLNALLFRARDGLVPLERTLRIDNRYHEQVLSKTALIRGTWKLVVDNQRDEQELFRLSDDHFSQTRVDQDAFAKESTELRTFLDQDNERLRRATTPQAGAGVSGNVSNDLNYHLRLSDKAHYDPDRSQLLLLRTFNVAPFREVLKAALEYFPSHRIHLPIQESVRSQVPGVAACCSYTIPDNLRDPAQLLTLGIPAGDIRYALVPYNGRELIQYYSFLRALRDLRIEKIFMVSLRGHLMPINDVDSMLCEMGRYLELVPEHEALRRKYAQVNWFC